MIYKITKCISVLIYNQWHHIFLVHYSRNIWCYIIQKPSFNKIYSAKFFQLSNFLLMYNLMFESL